MQIVSRLAHVALTVPDVDAAEAFYNDMFGLATVAADADTRYMASGRSATYELALTRGDSAAMDHFAFTVCGIDALDEAARRLDAAGVETRRRELSASTGSPKDWPSRCRPATR